MLLKFREKPALIQNPKGSRQMQPIQLRKCVILNPIQIPHLKLDKTDDRKILSGTKKRGFEMRIWYDWRLGREKLKVEDESGQITQVAAEEMEALEIRA